MQGVKNFKPSDHGLLPIACDVRGGFVFLNFGAPVARAVARGASTEPPPAPAAVSLDGAFGEVHALLRETKYEELKFLRRVTYDINCNWKVFVDNYLE